MSTPRAPLTSVERKLWHFLIDHLASEGYQPSLREIARRFAIPSTRTVSTLLTALEHKGYVRRAPGRSRSLVIDGVSGATGTQPVPFVHWAPDGSLVTDSHFAFDRAFLAAEDSFVVRANAEDAPRLAVREGDLLLVAPSARVADDAAVVVRVGVHLVVRTMERRGTSIRLIAPGEGAQDIVLGDGDDFEVLGPLGAVVRVTAPLGDMAAGDGFEE